MFDLLEFELLEPFETINLCNGYDPIDPLNTSICYNPFSCISVLRNDNFHRFATGIDREKMKMKEDFPHSEGLQRKRNLPTEEEQVLREDLRADFEQRYFTETGIEDLRPYKKSTLPGNSNYKKPRPKRGELILHDNMQNTEFGLINDIRVVIPSPEVLEALLDCFFTDLFPYMPYLIESDFRKKVARLMLQKNFTITNRMDLATVGTLFILIKLTFTSIQLHTHPTDKERFILENPSKKDLEMIAYQCYYQLRLARRPALELLQLLVYINIYKKLSPVLGITTVSYDHQAEIAEIVFLAKLLGLHRDGSFLESLGLNEENLDGRRRIWIYILTLDLDQAAECGCSLIVREDEYDTKLPTLNPSHSIQYELDHMLRISIGNILRKVFNFMEPNVNLLDIIFMLDKLDADLGEFSIDHLVCHPDDSLDLRNGKLESLRRFIMTKNFLGALYFHLTLHFESKGSFLLFEKYAMKTLQAAVSAFKLLEQLSSLNSILQLKNAEFIIAPQIVNFATKASILIASFLLRSIHRENESLDEDHKEEAKIITKRLLGIVKGGVKWSKQYLIKRPYYLCWNHSEVTKFYLKIFQFLMMNYSEVYGPGIKIYDNSGSEISTPLINGFCHLSNERLRMISSLLSDIKG
ncbi:unnamed protein product [Kuraishia capsulata CBS 1993]|uniref:Uncharacterized protein n=1 Tax=Kuraishia capsulata CBS 1993 TaxID=1382522 RepID=W6MS56_9ASCO|nr:uncharacterized protein KUCA_T00004023001 [Kuraishia capsulata CBS 1993]CDK28042.1 unnamed protein product [Kuraishia capsulata CBS 1993]